MGTLHVTARRKRVQVLALRESGVDDGEIARTLGYAGRTVVRTIAWRAREERKRELRRLKTISFATSNQEQTNG